MARETDRMSKPAKNWVVPMYVSGGYWNVLLYMGDYPTAKEAQDAARVLAEQLPAALDAKGRVEVGEPEELA